jgi:mono/diheme cytochrome c family protein
MFRQGWKRNVGIVVLVLIVLFILIQLIPVHKTNPPVVNEPIWDSAQTRALAKDACFDCHSNETIWPWYSKIAPSSWLLVRDVDEGRRHLNFSEWGQHEAEIGEITRVINEGEMPPWYFRLIHPKARLSDSEKQTLVNGLQATFAQSPGQVNGGGGDD